MCCSCFASLLLLLCTFFSPKTPFRHPQKCRISAWVRVRLLTLWIRLQNVNHNNNTSKNWNIGTDLKMFGIEVIRIRDTWLWPPWPLPNRKPLGWIRVENTTQPFSFSLSVWRHKCASGKMVDNFHLKKKTLVESLRIPRRLVAVITAKNGPISY